MNSVFYFEIQVDNVDRAMTFYQTVFGWKFSPQEGTPVPYWSIATEGIRGGLLKRPAPAPPGGTNAFVCSMEVADFDTTAENILAAGGTIAMPKFSVPGKCWQGYFLDPEQNTFGLFQVDPQA